MTTTLISQLPNLTAAGTRVFYPAGFSQGLGQSPYSLFVMEDTAPAASFNGAGFNPPKAYASNTTVEGEDIATPLLTETDATTYTVTRYTNGFSLSEVSARFVQPDMVPQWYSQMGVRAAECPQKAVYDLLRLGFSSGLFSTTHTSNVGNLSNAGSTALSHASLAVARAALMKQKSVDGDPAGQMPAFLVVPPDLEYLARQIVASTVTDTNMQINPLAGSLTILTSPFLTDTTDWFLVSAKGMNPFRLWWAIKPSARLWYDDDSRNLKAVDSMAFAVGVQDWRGSFGSQVTGS